MKTKRIVSLVLVFLILLSTFSFDLKASDAINNEDVFIEDNEEKLLEENAEEESLGANEPTDASSDDVLGEESSEEVNEEEDEATVSFDNNWTYFEDGMDPSSDPEHNTWAFGQYNNKDANKKTGQAPFGAKDDQEYTKGGFTTKTLLKHHMADGKTVPTYFFVNKFNVEDTMSLWDKSLKFDLAYDDAVIIYLNREVIYKANVPDAGYSQSVEYGCKEKVGKPVKAEVSIPFSDLQGKLTSGVNYLAVELHQYSDKSSDIYFDMQNIRFEDEAQEATSENEFATPVLTIGSNPSERNFTWYNKVNAAGYVEVKEFGDSEGEIFTAEANENNRKEGFVNYKAHISGLYPDTEYELTYWNGDNGSKSDPISFRTAKEGDFSFFLVGDPQIGASGNKESDAQGWDKTLNILKERMNDDTKNFAFLLSAGDQINNVSFNEEEYQSFIERSALKGMTLAPVIGNHDGEGGARSGYFEHFALPDLEDSYRADYAYVYNNTLFISLDSTFGWNAARHNAFVKKTVEKYQDKVDWKVLTFHHAIYSVASHANDVGILNRRKYIPQLVKENGIDAVLMGHDHVYVRTHLMDGTEPLVEWKDGVEEQVPNEYINPKGALYITANSGSGSKFYRIKSEKFDYAAVQNQERVPNYSEISVTDNTFKVVTYRTSDNSVVDEVTLKKEKAYTPVLTIGNNQSERNFTWYSESLDKGHVEVKEVKNPESVQSIECDAHEDNRKEGYANYKANIKGLKADTEYELVYWNGENGTKSEAVNFKTAKEGDFSFFLVGDPQIGASGNTARDAEGWDKTLNIMAEKMKDPNNNFAFLLSAGDQINDYDDNEDQYKLYIERSALKGMTLAPVIGNHDGEGNARSGYFEHFALPDLNEEGRADYAYVYNNTLFISLDSTYGWDAARHNAFVKKTVEKYKDKVDWKVLTFHHAIYSVASHANDGDILDRRKYIPQLVKENGIDAVLMGHDHVYVRSHIMDGAEALVKWENDVEGDAPSEYLNPKGALYITANSGSGSKFYRIQNEKFDYSAVQNQERVPNYSEISVTDNTFKVVTYRTSDGSVVDEVTLKKDSDEEQEEKLPDGELSQTWTYFDEGVDPAKAEDRYSWTKGEFNQEAVAKEASGNFGSLNGEKYYLKDEYYGHAFSADNQLKQKENKKNYPAYFFINSFNIENLEDFKAKYPNIKLGIRYQDAVIMYLNGHKIWQANALDSYEDNLSYGAGKTTGVVYKIIDNAWRTAIAPVEEDTVLTNRKFSDYLQEGKNYIAFEVHSRDEESSGVYFDLYDFAFEDGIAPDKALFYTPVMTIGRDQSERNFTWYNNVLAQGYVEVKELGKDDTAKTFMAQTNENNRKNVYVNYQAKITGLKADTEYEYTYWNGEGGEKSEPVRFKTAKDGDFSFFLVGDPQIGASGDKESDAQAWDTTLNKMSERMKDGNKNVAFLLSAGDQINNYDNNEDEYKLYIERSAFKGMTLAPVIGNHDGEGNARSGYFEHFALPDLNEEGRADYAYVYNNTLFISLDSTYGWDAARHNAFVKKTVEKYKDKVDWKVLTFHHAIYSVASHANDGDILDRRKYIPQLVKENGIDAVLMGHDHVYVRSHIMDGAEALVKWENDVEGDAPSEYLNPKGALYITANSGSGSKFYRIQNEKFDYSAVQNQERVPNYSEISVTDNTFKVVTYRLDGSVVDEVTLKKEKENPNPEPNPEPNPNPQPEPNPEPNPDNDNTIIIPPYEPDNRDEHNYRPRRPRTEKKEDKREEKKEETKTIETNTKPIEKTKLSPIEVADKVLPVNFTDIVNERRRDAIINLASRGVLAGMSKDKFMPNTTVTRAMVAAVFMRISRDKFINTSMSAKDIMMKDWYFNSVKWAMTHGIVAGYPDGSFKPMKKVSRQELAVMLEGLLKLYNINMPNIVDVDYSTYSYLPAWSHDAVIDVVRKGLLEVDQDGKLGYDKEVSRADFAYAIDRIVEFVLNN